MKKKTKQVNNSNNNDKSINHSLITCKYIYMIYIKDIIKTKTRKNNR
jgi:hypothetical protein